MNKPARQQMYLQHLTAQGLTARVDSDGDIVFKLAMTRREAGCLRDASARRWHPPGRPVAVVGTPWNWLRAGLGSARRQLRTLTC